MKKTPLWFPFALATSFALVGSVFFPLIRLCPFCPFFAIAYHRLTLVKSLWLSLGCGLILDLLSSQMHFGTYSLAYFLTTTILYQQKRHFFEEKPSALCLFSAVISSVSSLVLLLIAYGFDKQITISLALFISEVVIMPVLDAAYAFIWFACPIKLYVYIQRVEIRQLFKRNKPEDETNGT